MNIVLTEYTLNLGSYISNEDPAAEMGKFMKPGRWCFGGWIDCYLCKVTAAMGKKKIAKRSKIKSF